MEDVAPPQLRYAAIAQIVSGLANIFLFSWMIFFFWTIAGFTVGTILTGLCAALGCPFGCIGYLPSCLSFTGFLVVPLGILEMIAGVLGLTNPRVGATMMKFVAVGEILALLIGAIPSAIAGGLAFMFMLNPEVRAYLEGPSR